MWDPKCFITIFLPIFFCFTRSCYLHPCPSISHRFRHSFVPKISPIQVHIRHRYPSDTKYNSTHRSKTYVTYKNPLTSSIKPLHDLRPTQKSIWKPTKRTNLFNNNNKKTPGPSPGSMHLAFGRSTSILIYK